MTVKGDESKKSAVTRPGVDEEIPTYQEAVAGSSAAQQAPAPTSSAQPIPTKTGNAQAASTPANAGNNLYPFPSGPVAHGYGESPYHPDGTVRIAIVQGSGQLLPLHGEVLRRGPPAGRRFLVAFFWALVVYVIIGAVTGTIIQMEENAHQPKTPTGWRHHHEHKHVGDWKLLPLRVNKRHLLVE